MIIIFDVETTGKDRARDQIVELCVMRFGRGLREEMQGRTWRIRPTVPIHPEAQAVHGITADAVAECPTFDQVAAEIRAMFDAATGWGGYNVRFDIEMLQAELERAGLQPIDLSSKHIVDAFRLWQHGEPRSLMDAARRFAGGEYDAAHSASADVTATVGVLLGMAETFGIDPEDWAALAKVSDPLPERLTWLGPSKHFQWKDGAIVFGFGKHAGAPILSEPGFLQWMLRQDFPAHVKEIAHAVLYKGRPEFAAFIAARYPPPAPKEAAA